MCIRDRPLYPATGQNQIIAVIDGVTPVSLTQRDVLRQRWSGTIRLDEGEYELGVIAADEVGNETEFAPVMFAVTTTENGVVSARIVSPTAGVDAP